MLYIASRVSVYASEMDV